MLSKKKNLQTRFLSEFPPQKRCLLSKKAQDDFDKILFYVKLNTVDLFC
jgi:hypothetical protein